MQEIEEAITYDDVLLKPKRSSVTDLNNVDTSTQLTDSIRLNVPITSACMDTVTEAELAIALAREGGIGLIHRFMPIEREAQEVEKVKTSESHVIRNPETVPPDAAASQVSDLMDEQGISGILVVEDGILQGLVSRRDVKFRDDLDQEVRKVMTPREELITGDTDTSLDTAKEVFKNEKVEKLPLVDEDDRLQGLITAKDIEKIEDYPQACKDDEGRLR
ncbi:MAG: IMP dehydrogenase, partial [Candidatus Nanohaloarchaea archaeon]|nr:IMP dehydrogenase [Candidatus Nanohaloarchaea archaeon]